jgi:hypothetical protein
MTYWDMRYGEISPEDYAVTSANTGSSGPVTLNRPRHVQFQSGELGQRFHVEQLMITKRVMCSFSPNFKSP